MFFGSSGEGEARPEEMSMEKEEGEEEDGTRNDCKYGSNANP